MYYNLECLEAGSELALRKWEDTDPSNVPLPFRTVVLVDAAQGVLDNGGLRFFYEADFWHGLPYETIIAAYRRCGARAAANVLAKSLAYFPFAEPHKKALMRQEILLQLVEDEKSKFWKLDQAICGDKRVWKSLVTFMEKNADLFPAPLPQPKVTRKQKYLVWAEDVLNAATDSWNSGDIKFADRFFRRSIELMGKAAGISSEKLIRPLEIYAQFLAANKRKGEARKLLQRAAKIRSEK